MWINDCYFTYRIHEHTIRRVNIYGEPCIRELSVLHVLMGDFSPFSFHTFEFCRTRLHFTIVIVIIIVFITVA